MSSDRKSKNQRRKRMDDDLKDFPKIRKIRTTVNNIHEMMAKRHPATKILEELGKLRALLIQIETEIFKDRLRGFFQETRKKNDFDKVEDTICRLANHFARTDNK